MGRGRAPCCDKNKVKRGPWSPAEDLRLITFIQNHGHSNWRALPKQAGLLRCGKSCRLRWVNYLRPDVKRGNFTPEEEQTIINLHNTIGNKWSKIASYLPGRTDNEIKNVWNTHLKKRLRPNNNASDHRKHSKTSCSASPSCASSSITSSGDQNMDKAVDGDQGLQESEVKKPDESPGSLNLKKPTHPIDHHNEAKEDNASDSRISPTSYASNFSIFNNGPNEAPESLKSKVINPKGGDADAVEIEIPLESDVEFWELLDCLDPSRCGKTVENGGNQDSNLTKPEENLDNEIECSKWLRFLENDLGLASDVENQPKGQNMIPTIPLLANNLEPQISPGLDYFPIWPSSPQNLGI